jgi:hypothetical protein
MLRFNFERVLLKAVLSTMCLSVLTPHIYALIISETFEIILGIFLILNQIFYFIERLLYFRKFLFYLHRKAIIN